MTVYFAHSFDDYATPRARDAIAALRRAFRRHRIRDPESLDWASLATRYGRVGVYRHVVRGCQALVVLPQVDGEVSAGAALEVRVALQAGIPAFRLDLPTGQGKRPNFHRIRANPYIGGFYAVGNATFDPAREVEARARRRSST